MTGNLGGLNNDFLSQIKDNIIAPLNLTAVINSKIADPVITSWDNSVKAFLNKVGNEHEDLRPSSVSETKFLINSYLKYPFKPFENIFIVSVSITWYGRFTKL